MINGIGTETSTSLEPAPTAATDQSAAAAAADFETFLSLLTTQLRNQDPLKPLDSTEFVAQLASFSAVEQQINTNAKLDAITNALAGNRLDSAVQWVGKNVEFETSQIHYNGENDVSLLVEPPAEATSGTLTVFSPSNAIVATVPLNADPGQHPALWNGTRDDGSTAAPGDYRVSVNWWNGEEAVGVTTPLQQDHVNEVRLTGDSVKVTLSSGLIIPIDAIQAIISPTSDPAP